MNSAPVNCTQFKVSFIFFLMKLMMMLKFQLCKVSLVSFSLTKHVLLLKVSLCSDHFHNVVRHIVTDIITIQACQYQKHAQANIRYLHTVQQVTCTQFYHSFPLPSQLQFPFVVIFRHSL